MMATQMDTEMKAESTSTVELPGNRFALELEFGRSFDLQSFCLILTVLDSLYICMYV